MSIQMVFIVLIIVCKLGGLRRVHLHPLFAQRDVLIPEAQPFTFTNITQNTLFLNVYFMRFTYVDF